VRLPASALLGQANHGFYYLMQLLPQERLTVGVTGCAASEAMFEWTRKYVKERKAFGKTISSLQVASLSLRFVLFDPLCFLRQNRFGSIYFHAWLLFME